LGDLGEEKLPSFIDLKYGPPQDAVAELGQVAEIREMFLRFQKYLYEPVGVEE
jgi:type I restriction enzyme R subunit